MRKLPLWGLLLVAFLVVTYFIANYDMATGPSLPLFSSRRYDPFGSAAFRELLAARGRATHYLERPVPLRTDGATLVMVLPVDIEELDKRRFDRLLEWLRHDNRLLVLSRKPPRDIERYLDLGGLEMVSGSREMRRREWRQGSGEYLNALSTAFVKAPLLDAEGRETGKWLALDSPSHFEPIEDPTLEIVASSEGRAYAVSKAVGGGRITLILDPTPILNYAVAKADNAEILFSLIGPGDVYFDEYSLGLGYQESMMDWLKRAGLIPFLLQSLMVMYLMARSVRTDFGFVSSRRADADATAEKQIRILAALYEHTLTDEEIAERQETYRTRFAAKAR